MKRTSPFMSIRSITRLFLAISFLAPLFISSQGQAALSSSPVTSFPIITIPPEAFDLQLDGIERQKLPAKLSKLDASLAALVSADSELSRQQTIQLHGMRFADDRLQVQLTVDLEKLAEVRQAVAEAGGRVTKSSLDGSELQAWLPVAALESLANHPAVFQVRQPALLVYQSMDIGMYTTEGLDDLSGLYWHAAALTGTGVKIGIIDGGFDGYLSLLGTDLPAMVTAKNFVDGQTDAQIDATTEHGSACAEVIYDIAPGASLFLAKISTSLDLVEAVAWLRDTIQVDIISTSFGFYSLTPGDGTGQFENLVKSARDAGILWVTAAGNDQQVHWGGSFIDTDADALHNYYDGGEINTFGLAGGADYLIPAGYPIQIFLRWDDWTYVKQDYDLYLLVKTTTGWEVVAYSARDQSGLSGQTPTEFISIYAPVTGVYGFAIDRYEATRNVNFEINAPNMTGLHYRTLSRSLVNLADSPSAMTVAALDVTSPYVLETYSSQGPTNGPGGTATGGFIKPDISGYANVSTVSYGAGTYKFNGTSSATPHVAGAAALVLDAFPFYTPDQLQTFLEYRAVDMGAAGMDNLYGYGRLFLGEPPVLFEPEVELYLPMLLK